MPMALMSPHVEWNSRLELRRPHPNKSRLAVNEGLDRRKDFFEGSSGSMICWEKITNDEFGRSEKYIMVLSEVSSIPHV